jgi:Zn-dependent protease with chaperone function
MNYFLKYRLTAILFVFASFLHAQYQFSDYVMPKKIASRYNFAPDLKNPFVINYAALAPEDFDAYSKTCAYNKYNLFISGSVYLEWDDVENYLNVVLNTILPDSLRNKLHVYPYRSTISNAFTLPDGSIFINIGLISEMDDEAQLAVILGHEAAHFIHHDNHFTYKKKLETVRIDGDGKELKQFENAHEDREQEKAADFLGFDLAKNAGYNISSSVLLFQSLNYSDMLENRRRKKSRMTSLNPDRTKTIELLQTHPELKDRIDYLVDYTLKSGMKNAKSFIVLDETNFFKLTTVAKHQNLIILLENNWHRTCIESAFIYHLNDPEDKQTLYSLCEALRRFMYTDVKKEDAGFLTDNDHSGAFELSRGIFNDLTKLFVDSVKYKRIKDKINGQYAQPPDTYKQAFDYFIQKALKKNIVESRLTYALAMEDTSISRNSIRDYLRCPEAKYKEYAQALLSDKIDASLKGNSKEIVFCSSIDFVTLNKNEAVVQYERSENESKKFFDELSQSVKLYSGKQVVSINSMIEADFAMAQKIYTCARGMRYAYHRAEDEVKTESYYNLKKQKDVNFFKISPEYWMFFKENNLRSMEFYDAISVISKRKELYRVGYYSYNTTREFPTASQHIEETGKLGPRTYSTLFQRCIKELK